MTFEKSLSIISQESKEYGGRWKILRKKLQKLL